MKKSDNSKLPPSPSNELQEWLINRAKAVKFRDAFADEGGHILFKSWVLDPNELHEPLRTEALEYLRRQADAAAQPTNFNPP